MSKGRIVLVAPSGYAPDPSAIDLAARRLSARGWLVEADDAVFQRHHRFAGTDEQRASSLMEASVSGADVVMAIRGGYGISRLLPILDWQALGRAARDGTRFIGHSDFTAFQLALLAKTGQVSLAGPMACYDFGSVEVSQFTLRHFKKFMCEGQDAVSVRASGQPKCAVQGQLWGGTLAMVNALLATPWFPKVNSGVLFLEDIGEHPYRIERMLLQLVQSGVIAKQSAVVLGNFAGYQLAPNDNGYSLDTVVDYIRTQTDTPIFNGLPFGHCRDKLTLPVGGWAEIETSRGGYRFSFRLS
jgi:muramoyltetrapeptide carboxypeptidase